MAKSPITLVPPSPTDPPPPRPLGETGLALWRAVNREYHVEDIAGVEILMQACLASDRLEALAAEIDKDGEIVRTATGGVRSHPGLKDEVNLRCFLVRAIEKLGLNYEAVRPTVGRPPGGRRHAD